MSTEDPQQPSGSLDPSELGEQLGSAAGGAARRLVPAVLAVVLLAAAIWSGAVFGLTIYNDYLNIPEEVQVPEVVGMEIRDAYEAIESEGLRLQIHESRYDKTVPKRVVLSQNPAASRAVRKGRTVLVSVSLGPELIEVPNVVGDSLRSARIAISNAKLSVGEVTFEDPAYGQDEAILNQNPSGLKEVQRGQQIHLHVRRAWR